ncbi:MAG: CAAX prenyl protease-related protein, partial [Bryobacteraceae bacterium]
MKSLPYVAPFGALIALLAIRPYLPLSPLVEQTVWILLMSAILALVARPVLFNQRDFRARNWGGSVLVGVAVFVIWIAPDRVFPGYHSHWLFTNSVTGAVVSSLAESSRGDAAVLTLRTLRAAVFVPIAEELFWRAWLMRWIISQDFTKIPLGAWSARAFWIVAVLFAVEHGALWDVGLAAGILYNWWMVRTKSLGDVMVAHGVTNLVLSAYVIFAGRWEY